MQTQTIQEAVRPVPCPADVAAARSKDRSAELARMLELSRRHWYGMATAASGQDPFRAQNFTYAA